MQLQRGRSRFRPAPSKRKGPVSQKSAGYIVPIALVGLENSASRQGRLFEEIPKLHTLSQPENKTRDREKSNSKRTDFNSSGPRFKAPLLTIAFNILSDPMSRWRLFSSEKENEFDSSMKSNLMRHRINPGDSPRSADGRFALLIWFTANFFGLLIRISNQRERKPLSPFG